MIYKELNIDYDKETIIKEIIECDDLFFEIPSYSYWINLAKMNKIFMVESYENYDSITYQTSEKVIKKKIKPSESFYIRNSDFKNMAYKKTKKIIENSYYHPGINNRLNYTKSVIENLPMDDINLVRVFVTRNTFLPTHQDFVAGNPNNGLGISLVPIHSGSPLMYYDPNQKKVHSIFSSSFLFNDSYLHGIPMVKGLRIDLRIFGNLQESIM